MTAKLQKANVAEILDLSPIQQGMLFHYLKGEENKLYHAQLSFSIKGKLDAGLLARAFEMVQAQHEALRLVFRWEKLNKPLQIILKEYPLPIGKKDFSQAAPEEKEQLLAGYLDELKEARFDLEEAALRLNLTKLSDSLHILTITHHHILYDGWSTGIILSDWFGTYNRLSKGDAAAFEPKPTFKTLHKALVSQNTEDSRQYWSAYLEDFAARPLVSQEAQAEVQNDPVDKFRLERKDLQLEAFAVQHKVTKAAIIYAAFGVMLSKYLHTDDICVGIAMSNRPASIPGNDRVIGNFINTVPLRMQIAAEASLLEVVKQVNEDLIRKSQHTNTAYGDLKEWLRLRHDQDLFDIVLVGQNYPLNESGINLNEDVKLSLHSAYETTEFPLMVNIFFEKGIDVDIAYREGSIAGSQVEHLTGDYLDVIATLLQDSSTQVQALADDDCHRVMQKLVEQEMTVLPQPKPGELLPASYHQQRLWFIDEFESGYLYEASPVYHNIPLILHFEGALDKKALEASVQELLRRHDILRTQIITRDQQPWQQLAESSGFSLEQLSLKSDSEEVLRAAIEDFQGQPLSLSKGLLRGLLIERGADKASLVLLIHHILADRNSTHRLAEQLTALYLQKQGVESNEQWSYRDFAHWQQSSLRKLEFDVENYWRSQLGPRVKALEIPTDRPRAAVHIYQVASAEFSIPPALRASIRALAAKLDITEETVLMAGFKVLLNKYARHEEIVIGTSADNREIAGTQQVIGPMANLIVLRSFVRAGESFNAYLQQLHRVVQEGRRFQSMPFDKLVKDLAPDKDMSRTALFDVLFQYEDRQPELAQGKDLSIRFEDINYGYGKYDLNLFFEAGEEQLRGKLIYNKDYFDHESIVLFNERFVGLLQNLLKQPEDKIAAAEFLTQEEKARLITQLDHIQVPWPEQETITSLFVKQAQKTPERQALQFEDEVLSYAELDRRSTQVAVMLREAGVERESIVGMFIGRELNTVIGMLAIIKAGGAYMPIDIDYPEDRITYMIADSKPHVILTTEALAQTRDFDAPVLHFEAAATVTVPEDFALVSQPGDMAYIIYTSGTTGNPKGVMVEQGNVVRLLFNDEFQFDFNEGDVWTMFHSHCFDFSVWEIYGALLLGGKVIVIPKAVARETGAYLELLKREKVTILNQTPSAFYNLIQEELVHQDAALSLRYVIFGGEALSPAKLKDWHAKYPAVKLINMFGITETTVHVTYKEVGSYEIENNISNIGKPIPTLATYLLDEDMNLVPHGIAGELYVGGAGVSRGYLYKQELTDQRFVPSPFEEGKKLYKTGDLARVLNNGELEYCGRIDDQVQLRGFRIELGEIESQLLAHPRIDEAVVLCKESDGDKYLAGFYQAAEPIKVAELRNHLADRLPDYMIPSYFVHLRKMALTSSGKIDKRALPEPEITRADVYLAPQEGVQALIARIWSEILKVDVGLISADQSFFELGGHSLKAVAFINRLYKEINLQVPLNQIFNNPTIQELSAFIDLQQEGISQVAETSPAPIPKAPGQEYYPLSAAQKRLFFLHRFDEESLAYNMPLILRASGTMDDEQIEKAFAQLVDRHESLRTRIIETEDGPHQQVLEHADFRLERAGMEGKTEEEIIRDFVRPFVLREAPLLRVKIVETGALDYLLMIDLHHIISDGVSNSQLVAEFAALLQGKSLPELRLQYKDFACWEEQQAAENTAEADRQFWKEQYAEELTALELPCDFERPQVADYAGDMIRFAIDASATRRLQQLAEEEGSTLFMTLLAIYNIFLLKLSGQQDIVIGTPVAGRNHPDLEEVVGLFVNTLALRNQPRLDQTFAQFLKAVKENTLQAFAHQNYAYEQLIDELKVPRNTSRNPLFDVMFSMENFGSLDLQIPGLHLSTHEISNNTSKFDLTLSAREREDWLELEFEYASSLFSRARIEVFVEQFTRLIKAILDQRNDRIAQLEIISPAEKQRILHELSPISSPYNYKSYFEAFEAQVQAAPHAIALRSDTQELSYAGLHERSKRIASQLSTMGLGPNSRVALCLDRSPDLVAAIIGVFAAGAAYVPVDTGLPKARRQQILEDCSPQVIIAGNTSEVAEVPCAKLVQIDALTSAAISADWKAIPPAAQDLAYIIYTSGTTGKPKGAMVHHAGMMNHIEAMIAALAITQEDVIAQTASISFDISVWQLLTGMIAGACTRLYAKELVRDVPRLMTSVQEDRITILQVVPSLMSSFLDEFAADLRLDLAALRWMIPTGEALTAALVRRWYQHYPAIPLLNAYGPAEASDDVTLALVEASAGDKREIPVGKAIQHMQVYIMDDAQQLCPIGVRGEICVAGIGVGLGYWNDPQKTSRSFVPNPYAADLDASCKTIYRTGDLGYMTPDGAVVFVGRKDYQLKIRGFRIEPGEIEHVMQRLPQVKQAVVKAFDRDGQKVLAGYYVAQGGLSAKALKAQLADLLPDYMVPSFLTELPALPLTANGKVDKKALPNPVLDAGTTHHHSPNNLLEQQIRDIFAELLKARPQDISTDSKFLDIGGDSLKTTVLSNKIAKKLGMKITVSALFRYQTVAEIAAHLQSTHTPVQTEAVFSLPAQKMAAAGAWSSAQLHAVLHDSITGESIRKAFAAVLYRYSGAAQVSYRINTDAGWQKAQVNIEEASTLSTLALSLSPIDEEKAADKIILLQGSESILTETEKSALAPDLLLAHQEAALRLEYNQERFEAWFMQGLLDHLLLILAASDEQKTLPVAAFPLFSQSEKRMQGGLISKGYDAGLTPLRAMLQQAQAHPDRKAVSTGTETATYGELAEAATRVAAWLQSKGIAPGETVGLSIQPGADLPALVYGIWQCGAVYVPINPAYPASRKEFIAADAACGIVIEEQDLAEIRVHKGAARALAQAPDTALYILYTSGTTGQPKGVMVNQAALADKLQAEVELLSRGEALHTCLMANYSFDVSLLELFLPAYTGGSVFLPAEGLQLNYEDFALALCAEGVNILQGTPSYFEVFFRFLSAETMARLNASVHTLCIGGESLSKSLVATIREKLPALRLNNHYGPTEAVIDALVLEDVRSFEQDIIGRPLSNTSAYVLSPAGQLQALGVPGELYIGGRSLAEGYYNRPELTAKAFVTVPGIEGTLYRSGDMAIALPGGNIRFLGRLDEQVKLRGYRIELGDVKNALLQLPHVREAAVKVLADANGQYLTAWLVAETMEPEQIKEQLAESLPDYMIPAYLLAVEQIPLTANGKADFKALPLPERTGSLQTAPDTQLEMQIRQIWASVLQIPAEEIGTGSNFFDLGGDSLKTTILSNQMQRHLGISIELRALFEHQTIRQQASNLQDLITGSKSEFRKAPLRPSYPLSSAQKRLYFLQQFDRKTTAYNMPLALEIKGDLDQQRLQKAFAQLIALHEPLRTTFHQEGEQPVQRIAAAAAFSIEALQGDSPAAAIRAFVRPFDLSTGPLLRVGLMAFAERQYLLCIDLHHIITDGISNNQLVKDFMHLYTGQDLPMPEYSYKDIALAQQSPSYQAQQEKDKAYWLSQFTEELSPLQLPTDYERPAVKSYEGAVHQFSIPAGTVRALRSLARKEDATLFMVFLSAWYVLLAKMSGQRDLCIGTPVAGRNQSETEHMVGMFVHTLPLRAQLSGKEAFGSFLRRVKNTVLDGIDHQRFEYENLIDLLSLNREMSRNPLFDVLFSYENFEDTPLQFAGLEARSLQHDYASAQFDLTLNIAEKAGGDLSVNLYYATRLYKEASISRMAQAYLLVLDQLIAGVSDLASINILTAAEKETLFGRNATAQEYPKEESIISLFRTQVARTPGAKAVSFAEQTLSYAALDKLSDQFAQYLVSRWGVQRGDKVAIMLPREQLLIPAIYGILKAGAAYVPLGIDYPAGRIHDIIEEAGIGVLLSRSQYLPEDLNLAGSLLDLNETWADILQEEPNQELAGPQPNDLAYVIFTSGSTGKPKGVMIEHHAVVNRILWMQSQYPIAEGDCILQKTPITFDVSVWELFWWSWTGASLHLPAAGAEKEPGQIIEAIAAAGVTTMHFVPSMLSAFLAYSQTQADMTRLRGLRYVFTSGEALKPSHVSAFAGLFAAQQTSLINLYGPTEATVDVSYFACDLSASYDDIPIGLPVFNTGLWIIDQDGQLLPPGAAGELVISGVQLARGYLNRPDLTAERFVEAAFDPTLRLYRTGDLARWKAGEEITYLGRIDHQVKIRGYRIELGEIERVLVNHEQVAEAIVTVYEQEEEKMLVAYYQSGAALPASVLREHLAAQLPAYMIPGWFMHLEEMPLSANGKLDRKALPLPQLVGVKAKTTAQNDLQKILQELWAEVLHLAEDRIGIDQNFFALGGHSIKAIHLVNQIAQRLERNLEVRSIFEYPTIAELATYLEREADLPATMIQRQPDRAHYPASPAQERLYFQQMLLPQNLAYNISGALRIKTALSIERIRKSLQGLIDRHEALRTSFQLKNEQVVQQLHTTVPLDFSVLDPAGTTDATAAYEAFIKPFDLSKPSQFRAALYPSGEENLLFIDMHHIICDGISYDILVQDFVALYEGKDLPVGEIRYVDYAIWQKSKSADDTHKAYWQEQLSGDLPMLDLPVMADRSEVAISAAKSVRLEIEGPDYERLNAFKAAQGLSGFALLLSAYYLLLSKITGQSDVIIGTDVAGRSSTALQGIVGSFVNILPLRSAVDPDLPVADFLQAVKTTISAGIRHQDFQFNQMVDMLDREEEMGVNPIAQVHFAFADFAETSQRLDAIDIAPVLLEREETTQYEFKVEAFDRGGLLQIDFIYSPELYDEGFIQIMAVYYKNILRTILRDENLVIADIELEDSLAEA